MSTWKKRPVTLIIADAGPLISLAAIDRMELLQTFGQPVLVCDVVKEECFAKPGRLGEQRLRAWFETDGKNQYHLINTPYLDAYRIALKKQMSGEDRVATAGHGDATISWLLKNLFRFRGKEEIALLLTEDSEFGDSEPLMLSRRAHVISTRFWLNTLERLGIIPSAKNIIGEIANAGRVVAKYNAARPAIIDKGTRSDWEDRALAVKPRDDEDGSGGGAGGGPGRP